MKIITKSLDMGVTQAGNEMSEANGLQVELADKQLRLIIPSKGKLWTVVLGEAEIEKVRAALKPN